MKPSIKSSSEYWAVIPAAGTGQRMQGVERAGASVPKQYLLLNNEPVLMHSLRCFLQDERCRRIVVVLHPADQHWRSISCRDHPKIETVAGGNSRTDSVYQGVLMLAEHAKPDDWVLVHDAARPCLDSLLVDHLLKQVECHAVGGILACPVTDALKRDDGDGQIAEAVLREGLWQAQTPQCFRYDLLRRALKKAIEEKIEVSDSAEAVALLKLKKKPMLVMSRRSNIKITYPEDLVLASCLLGKLFFLES